MSRSIKPRAAARALPLLLPLALAACGSTIQKLEEIGKPPALAAVDSPTRQPGYEPVSWPLPENQPPGRQYANSLWQPGARAFFRDQRANRVGDILRVNITIKDKAELDNETERKRDTSDTLAAPKVVGLERRLFKALPGKADSESLLDITGNTNSKGTGNVKREEKIQTQIAALVTQVLPNGNFVISGKQEISVNFELREVSVRGVIRPEDIRADNTVDASQIAEARITYGGRGQLTDMQQPRWGSQALEVLMPF